MRVAAVCSMGLLLGLLLGGHAAGHEGLAPGPADDLDDEPTPAHSRSRVRTTVAVPTADGRCSANDDKDCPLEAAATTSYDAEGSDRRINNHVHGKPVVPDEDPADLGFLYARSLSLSVDDDLTATNPTAMVRGRALRNRVFGQTWCSATSCPVSAALTLSNTSTRHQTRKVGQGEALVACMDCSFSATSVSIVDGEAVCAAASSTNVARVVCVAVCQWEGLDCTCSSGCSSNELGSESIHTYSYQVTAASGVRELLGYLHRLASRVHNTAEHLNIAGQLDMPGKSRQVRANVERRFGRDRAKAVPLLFYGPGNMSRR